MTGSGTTTSDEPIVINAQGRPVVILAGDRQIVIDGSGRVESHETDETVTAADRVEAPEDAMEIGGGLVDSGGEEVDEAALPETMTEEEFGGTSNGVGKEASGTIADLDAQNVAAAAGIVMEDVQTAMEDVLPPAENGFETEEATGTIADSDVENGAATAGIVMEDVQTAMEDVQPQAEEGFETEEATGTIAHVALEGEGSAPSRTVVQDSNNGLAHGERLLALAERLHADGEGDYSDVIAALRECPIARMETNLLLLEEDMKPYLRSARKSGTVISCGQSGAVHLLCSVGARSARSMHPSGKKGPLTLELERQKRRRDLEAYAAKKNKSRAASKTRAFPMPTRKSSNGAAGDRQTSQSQIQGNVVSVSLQFS